MKNCGAAVYSHQYSNHLNKDYQRPEIFMKKSIALNLSTTTTCALLISAMALSMASCQKELLDDMDKEMYTREFIKQFGVPASDQDWTMISRVNAVVDKGFTSDATLLSVYTYMPGNPECRAIARLNLPVNSFNFEIPKGIDRVYVQLENANGLTTYAGYMPVTDGQLYISASPASRSSQTDTPARLYDLSNNPAIGTFDVKADVNFWKSVLDSDYPNGVVIESVTKDKKTIASATEDTPLGIMDHEKWDVGYTLNGNVFSEIDPSSSVNLIITYTLIPDTSNPQWKIQNEDNGYTGKGDNLDDKSDVKSLDDTGTSFIHLPKEDVASIKSKGGEIKGYGYKLLSVSYQEVTAAQSGTEVSLSKAFKLYGMTNGQINDFNGYKSNYITGLQMDEYKAYKISDLSPIVGSNGVFKEQVGDGEECNLVKYKDKLNPLDGVEYVVSGDNSEVTLEYFYGCTAKFNVMGYFYYQEGDSHEKIMKSPKFLLMYDACPGSNLKYSNHESGGFQNFGSLDETTQVDEFDQSQNFANNNKLWELVNGYESDNGKESLVLPTTYRLVYYDVDENGNAIGQGRYQFPVGTHIGFFLIGSGQYYLHRYDTARKQIYGNSVFFSISWMNAAFGTTFNMGHTVHKDGTGSDSDGQDAWPAFVTYKWNGQYVLGAEDAYRWGDHDMNDMLFYVRGVESAKEEDVPEMNDNPPTVQSWIVAAEDLGNSGDYDFNDVVVGISHLVTNDVGENKFYITPLAAGGTLPVYLKYNGDYVGGEKKEFHSYFNVSTNTMHNTRRYYGPGSPNIEVEAGSDFSLTDFIGLYDKDKTGAFSIEIEASEETIRSISLREGDIVPQLLILPGTWQWPTETTSVRTAYPKFDEWVKNTATSWSAPGNYDATKVINHGWKGVSL